jgi:hypothetical protein
VAGTRIPGRAFVVPASTGNLGYGEGANVNNFTANSRAKSVTVLVATAAADGLPVDPAAKRVTAHLPNWLRMVMHFAGHNHGPAKHLPAELHVPVWIDATTRQIDSLDVDGAATELAELRRVGRRHWLETEAPLSDVRNVFSLPGAAARAVRGAVSELRDMVGEIRHLGDTTTTPRAPISADDLEARRRNAVILRYQLERNPKQHEQLRKSALQAGPSIARNARAGTFPADEFDAWVMVQETSGVITADEARQYRDAAGR